MPTKIFPVTPMNASLGALGGHTRYAKNAIGHMGSYRGMPVQGLGTGATLTGGPPNAMHTHLYPTSAGTSSYTGDLSTVFVGTQTRLYTLATGGAADVSRAANYAQTIGDEPCAWSFCSYGNDIIATNYVDEVQYRAGNSGLFANLITSAFKPQARHAVVARTALILANLEGSAGAGTGFADEYAWSVFGNAASFDTAGGAGRQRSLAFPGQLTGLVGGDFFRLFKATSISGVQYTGSSVTPWREDTISDSVGTPFGKSIVKVGEGEVAFFGGSRFFRQAGMNPPIPIGPQLGSELTAYEVSPVAPVIRPIKLLTYPMPMLTEDRVMHGVRCSRTGIIFWLYEAEGRVPTPDAKVDFISWDPTQDLWSVGEVILPISCLTSYPDLAASYFLSGIVGATWDTTQAKWMRFTGPNADEVSYQLGIQPIELDGGEANVFRISAIMPLFTWDEDPSHTTPPGVRVTLQVWDDPYLRSGRAIGPLQVGDDDNDWGWMYEPVEGRFLGMLVSIPQTSHRVPVFNGVAVEYEIVSSGSA